MKNFIITLILLISTVYSNGGVIDLGGKRHSGINAESISSAHFSANIAISDLRFSEIITEKGTFTELSFRGSGVTHEVGRPQMPVFRELIIFPDGSEPILNYNPLKETEISLSDHGIKNRILPAQPGYSKSSRPEERIFVIEESFYEKPGYTKSEPVKITKIGTMRGVSFGVLEISPVSYDPVANSIRVITDIDLEITYSGGDSEWVRTRSEHYSPFFENAFSEAINSFSPGSKNELTSYPVTYLIAANEALTWNAKLQQFIDWKTQKGFRVEVNFFPSSATVSDVDQWVEDRYENLSPKPSFLLIIGDESGDYVVPSEVNPPLGSGYGVTRSDHIYAVMGELSDENRIPSIHVGRMSINSLENLNAQIDKTLWYEKGQFEDDSFSLSYLTRPIGVAGHDTNWAERYGNPHIRYGWNHYFNTASGMPGAEKYLYPESSSSAAAIRSYVSQGANFFNYTAHGNNTSFGDPQFNIDQVNNLENEGKYPLVIGNCCLTGSFGFQLGDCFGEAWLNAPGKGGIGFIGASMNTYWDEDLAFGVGAVTGFVNNQDPPLDQVNVGMYDGVMMRNYPTQAGMKLAALLAVERYGGGRVSAYWSSYHLFGDPSLMVYFGIPEDNNVEHRPVITPGSEYFSLTADPGSYAAITDESGELYGAAEADDLGYILIPFSNPFLSEEANLVVTGQFKKPYFATLESEEFTGPYLVLKDHEFSTKSYGSDGTIDIELENIGISESENITISILSESPYISFDEDYKYFGSINEGESLRIDSFFSYSISQLVTDRELIGITLEINDTSKRTYRSNISFYAEAPNIVSSHYFDADVNPGDTRELTIVLENTGSAPLNSAETTLREVHGRPVSVSSPQIVTVVSKETEPVLFTVTFDSVIPSGELISFELETACPKGYSNLYEFDVNVGLTEDFESGDFTRNEWTFSGDADWVIDDEVFNNGLYSARSGDITHNETTSMSVSFEFVKDGYISFYRKTSSEINFDLLEFYIDDVMTDSYSGIRDWEKFSYPVNAGIRTFEWRYTKDGSVSTASDCAWVDDILAANILLSIETDDASIPSTAVLYNNYPNPFNPFTTLSFSVPSTQNVKLRVYNSNGQMVDELLDRRVERGKYSVVFDASGLKSGVYFYTLDTGSIRLTQKMLLVK